MNNNTTKKLIYTAVCIAIGIILPQAFHLLPISNVGSVLLPMHIPVLICGFICGYKYGAICGIVLPFLSSILTGMPPLFPIGVSMMAELATYGLLTGILYEVTKGKVLPSLLLAMLGGRIIMGISSTFFMGLANMPFGFEAFIAGAFVTALPGLIIQIMIIPSIVFALKKLNLLAYSSYVT
ncbi:ECF transporter S component [Psychrobacillus sp. INOP01]|uniref:ECF transporter S component n=1 Tax=Psychrobacillus sp. INOP01 TaxID=2829187 RepID=UPI001BAADB0D|nr:ECF transporter S component [Psychrobacillus sp. INOP01]QUG42582.1 ECF transporter S component [Psychrobacillus sp. INOP01]